MKGSVDKVTSEGSVGWLYAEPRGRKPLVQAFLQHQLIGEAVADLYRPDLEQAGLGDGRHGFEIGFNQPVDAGYLPLVCLRPEGYDLTIPLHGVGGFLDIVRRVLADYPSTGRNRSVLGGLWTDRMDGPSLLAGRVAVGSVAAELQPALTELIANGHVTLHGAMAAHPLGDHEFDLIETIALARRNPDRVPPDLRAALTALAGFLFIDPLVRLLRAVFDDHPVAYRLDVLRGTGAFMQACGVEPLPSPAECALVYLSDNQGAHIELVRDSHELPEFSSGGKSRWTPQGAAALRELVSAQAGSVDSLELDRLDAFLVGPGCVHRVMARESSLVLRALVAPRRITPLRFLEGEASWLEGVDVSGARVRV